MQLPFLQSTRPIPTYARICGRVALVLAVVSVLMPRAGILDILPIVVVLGCLTLYGGFREFGAGILVMSIMDIVLSPAFWGNPAHATHPFSWLEDSLTSLDLVGILAMTALLFRPKGTR